jgi:manganese/zinc/iron transport system substrate-binding protein
MGSKETGRGTWAARASSGDRNGWGWDWKGTLILLILLPIGCGGAGGPEPDGLRVVATTGMVADLASRIGGDRVRVTGLMGPGVDPHLYKASAGDVRSLASADLILYNGLHLEAALAEVLEEMDGRIRTRAVTDGIPPSACSRRPSSRGSTTPTSGSTCRSGCRRCTRWPRRSPRWTPTVRRPTVQTPPRSPRARGPRCMGAGACGRGAPGTPGPGHGARRVQLLRACLRVRGRGPARTVDRYGGGDRRCAAPGGSRHPQGDPRDLRRVLDPPNAMVEAVQAAVRSRGGPVEIGGILFSDAMGDPGTEDGTYVGMVRHNVNTIVDALTGGAGGSPGARTSEIRVAVEVNDLTVAYHERPSCGTWIWTYAAGALTAVVGPNGAGKTTLIKSIIGLVRPAAGQIRVLGRPGSETRRDVAYVPQRGSVDWDFPTSVLDVVLMGTYGSLGGSVVQDPPNGSARWPPSRRSEWRPSRSPDQSALRGTAAAGVPGPRPRPGCAPLPHGRAVPGCGRTDRAGDRGRPPGAARPGRRSSRCTTPSRPFRSTSTTSCC